MSSFIKKSFLFLIITTIIACKGSSEQNKIETIKVPLITTDSLEKEQLERQEVEEQKVPRSAAYNLYQKLYRLNGMNMLAFSDFQTYYKFTSVKEISANQKLVVLGMEYDDSVFEVFLLNRKKASIWELKAVEKIDTRFMIQPSDVQYDSINQLLHFVVEQVWASHGDLTFELFYQVTADTMLRVLDINVAGGQELDIAMRSQDGCNMELVVNFNSELDKVSKNELQFLYQYELLLYSKCDSAIEIRDIILKGTDRITYIYDAKEGLYVPNWNSLKNLNQNQFEAITSWGDLDPFELEIAAYCQKIENTMPRSAQLLKTAFY